MSQKNLSIDVDILGKTYQLSCPPDEREDLLASARLLDERMRSFREKLRMPTLDGIAVIAALNLTHDLLRCQARQRTLERQLAERVDSLTGRIDTALAETNSANESAAY